MKDVKFTEKELGFINECTIDKKGNITSMPATNPFPSLYRKGIVEKRKDRFVVGKEFRDMFYTEDQVIDLTIPEAELGAKVKDKPKAEPVDRCKFDWPDVLPVDIKEFRVYLGNVLTVGSTKNIEDEFMFIDVVGDVFEFTRRTLTKNGREAVDEYGTSIGHRKAWRRQLAARCAEYFDVECKVVDTDVYFDGEGYTASACEFVYKYLFTLGNRIAQRHYDDLLGAGKETKGVYNEKATEFLDEVAKRFQKWSNEWAEAHTVVDPVTGEAIGEISEEYDD